MLQYRSVFRVQGRTSVWDIRVPYGFVILRCLATPFHARTINNDAY